MTKCLAGIVAASGGGSGPVPGSAATHYDGVADQFKKTSAFTGISATAGGQILSCWHNSSMALGSALSEVIFASQSISADGASYDQPSNQIGLYDDSGYVGATNKVRFYVSCFNAGVAGAQKVVLDVPIPDLDGAWHNVICAQDFQTGGWKVFYDDNELTDPDGYSTSAGTPFTVDFSLSTYWTVGCYHLDASFIPLVFDSGFYADCLAELWWTPVAIGQVPDLSVESNRRKFINADLTPADLGANGQLPFGTAPIAYFPAGDGVNKGTGGDLDPVGAPSACSTAPDVYGTSATHYDGVNDYAVHTGEFTGLVNGPSGTFSAWLKNDGVPDINGGAALLCSSNGRFEIGTFQYDALTSSLFVADALGSGLNIYTDAFSNAGWHHLLVSWDTGVVQVYIDDQPVGLGAGSTSPTGDVNYVSTGSPLGWGTRAEFSGGGLDPTIYDGAGCQSEMFFDIANYLDLSIEANRRKFISADLKPVSLGGQGQLPFGTPPIFYSRDGSGTNLGTGGSLTAVGTPSICGSAP